MPAFPHINGTVIAQMPFDKAREYRTAKTVMPCGITYTWRYRTNPLHSWPLNYSSIPDSEAQILEDFFLSVEGRLEPFDFTDPDTLFVFKCRFATDTFDRTRNGPDDNQVRLLIVEDMTP
jgi:hypothetical protein